MGLAVISRHARKRFRAMTSGEIAMASRLFGDAIDYHRVRIYNRRYLPFGLQPVNCAMTPNGHIYFHKSRCLLDFSCGSAQARHWFMHEMVHVWQHQLGYPVRLRGAVRIGLSYHYVLAMDKTLSDGSAGRPAGRLLRAAPPRCARGDAPERLCKQFALV
jgi:hypothetical protein